MVTLEDVTRLFYGGGDEVSGWAGTQEELIELAAISFPGKAFCVVKKWILIDLVLTSDEKAKLTHLGLLSAVLFAHEVVLDSKGRFQPQMWVRSNFGVSFSQGYMFETESTVYLLCGAGLRKQASVGAAFSMKAG